MVVEKLFGLPGPVHHLIVNAGDVEHQAHHQAEACTQHINNDRQSEQWKRARRSLYSQSRQLHQCGEGLRGGQSHGTWSDHTKQ